MPELPEVETTLRGIEPHIVKQKVVQIVIRQPKLRWPIPSDLDTHIEGQKLLGLERRGKYILFQFKTGEMILHLGMSGRLSVVSSALAQKHDHVDIYFANKKCLRFTDPRRFGAILWHAKNTKAHALLAHLGPEPLSDAFDGDYLHRYAQGRKISIKALLMDNKAVVGVGNIYAAEALFLARIHPQTPAGSMDKTQYRRLAKAVKKILTQAIEKGGTTLRDFMDPKGKPGYFSLELKVYGRGGKACVRCGERLSSMKQGQRTTVWCANCQK